VIEIVRGSVGHRLLKAAPVVAAAAFVVVTPAAFGPADLHRVTTGLAIGVTLLALSYLLGQVGLLSLAHGALMGIGAVAATHVLREWGWPYLAAPPAGAALGLAVGAGIGIVALRVARLHLALFTLAVAVSFTILLRRYGGGPLGTPVPARAAPTAPGWTGLAGYDEEVWQFLLVVAGALIAYAAVQNLCRGAVGRAVTAGRDDPVAATVFGVNVAATSVAAFAASGAVAGWAGGLRMLDTPFVIWTDYPFAFGIELFALVTIMGRGHLLAALLAGLIYTLLPVWLADRGFVGDETLLYAVFLVVVVVVFRGRGLADGLERAWHRLVVIVEPGDRPVEERTDDPDLDAVEVLEPFRAPFGGDRSGRTTS
jgi:branched-chain amino acid transport system permease protein